MVARRPVVVGVVMVVALTACGGGGESTDGGSEGAASPASVTFASVTAPSTAGSVPAGGTSPDEAPPLDAPNGSLATGPTDPTLPATSTLPPGADDSIAQAVVDGHGYDVCDLLVSTGLAAELVGDIDPNSYDPRTMTELALANGRRRNGDAFEGAISCSVAGPSNPSGTPPRVTLRIWTDDQLRFTLGDQSATAAARGAALRDRYMTTDPLRSPARDVPGIGDGAWSRHDLSAVVVVAWQGPLLAAVDLRANTAPCVGDQAAVEACENEQLAPAQRAFTRVFPTIADELLSGGGRTAILPTATRQPETLPIATSTGDVDICAVAAAATAAAFPGLAFDPVRGEVARIDSLDGRLVEGARQCELRPTDADAGPEVEVVAYGADSPDGAAVFASWTARQYATPVTGLGDEAVDTFGTIHVKHAGVYFRVALLPTRSSTQYVDLAPQTQAIASAVAAAT